MKEDVFAFVITSLAFFAQALGFRFASDNYPKFHKENPLISYNGFNIAFVDFTNESWGYTRKLGFKVFMLAGFLHVFLCALSFLFPEINKQLVAGGSLTFFELSAFIYMLFKISNYKE